MKKRMYEDNEKLNFYFIQNFRGVFFGFKNMSSTSPINFINSLTIDMCYKLDNYVQYNYGEQGISRFMKKSVVATWNDNLTKEVNLDTLRNNICNMFIVKYSTKWNKLYDTLQLTYDPISDGKETISRQLNQATQMNVTSNDESQSTLSNQNKIRGFGSNEDSNTTSNTQTSNSEVNSSNVSIGNKSDNDTTESINRTFTNKYAYQDLIIKEIQLREDYSIINTMIEDIINELCLRYNSIGIVNSEIDLSSVK